MRWSHGSNSRDVPLSACTPSSRDFVLSFFPATRFRWQASISQNSITWHESVHSLSWETHARRCSWPWLAVEPPVACFGKGNEKRDLTNVS